MLHKIEKLYEDGQIYSEAQAQEYLNAQTWYNQEVQKLNNQLAKKKSDIDIKYMNINKQQTAQKAAATKPTTSATTPQKQTGTVTTTGQQVNADGSPAKNESYLDILKMKEINESIPRYENLLRIKRHDWFDNVKTEIENISQFKNDYIIKLCDKFKTQLKDMYYNGTSVRDAAENILSYNSPEHWKDMDESLNEEKFNIEMVEPDDIQNLKDYMDAESIPYIEDEEGDTIDFDKEELDDEWESQLEDMGFKPENENVDVDDIIDMEDDEDYEKDTTDENDDIDEDKVFYVKVEDEAGDFTGKLYKLFDEGEWRSKIVDGESETFDKLNFDPDWDEYDIIAFLRENYDDANLIDKDEFNEHAESPDEEPEEIEESLNESEKLDKVYNYYMNVDISTLDKSKTINKLFLSGYAGKHISYNINADTPFYKAWKAGRDRRISAEEKPDVEETFRGINGNGNVLSNQDKKEPLLDKEEHANLKEGHYIETLDEFVCNRE
jgi:hypothetical protein